jgi:hypothetical protein
LRHIGRLNIYVLVIGGQVGTGLISVDFHDMADVHNKGTVNAYKNILWRALFQFCDAVITKLGFPLKASQPLRALWVARLPVTAIKFLSINGYL